MVENNYITDAGREHLEELSSAYVLGALHDDEADLREFWFASTLGANSEILKEAANAPRLHSPSGQVRTFR